MVVSNIQSFYKETMDLSDNDTVHLIATIESDQNNQYLVALTSVNHMIKSAKSR